MNNSQLVIIAHGAGYAVGFSERKQNKLLS